MHNEQALVYAAIVQHGFCGYFFVYVSRIPAANPDRDRGWDANHPSIFIDSRNRDRNTDSDGFPFAMELIRRAQKRRKT
jgi:hypothetical protein